MSKTEAGRGAPAFDALAARLAGSPAVDRWGRMAFGEYVGQLSQTSLVHVDELIRLAEIHNGCRVLELGCGSGGFACHLAQRTGCDLIGIDWSPAALELAWARARQAGLAPRVRFERRDLQSADLPPGPFDVVVAIDALQFVPRLEIALAAVRHELADAGRLALIATVGRDDGWGVLQRATLTRAYAATGFGSPVALSVTASYARLVRQMHERWREDFEQLEAELGADLATARLEEDERVLELLEHNQIDRIVEIVRPSAPAGRPRALDQLFVVDHAVMRVAAWPIETVEPFASPDLARGARKLQRAELQRAEFERAYEHALTRERQALARVAREPRFRKALAVANPQLAARWSSPPSENRRRRARWYRVQAAVFQTLMRACGRPTPSGAWAGVAPVRPGADDGGLSVRCGPLAHHAGVDLRAFRALMLGLEASMRYRANSPLTLDPTVRATPDAWTWESDEAGVREWAHLPRHPVLDAVIGELAERGPRRADEVVAGVQERLRGDGETGEALRRIVERLTDRGLLRTPIRALVEATEPWTALKAVADRLLEPDRERWLACVAALRWLCDQLGPCYEALQPSEVEYLMTSAQQTFESLWRASGLDGPPPAPIIRLDSHAPFEATWGRDDRRRVTVAVRELLAFHAGDGGAELFRRQSLEPVARLCPAGSAVELEHVLRADVLAWPVGRPQDVLRRPGDVPTTREALIDQSGDTARAHCRRWAKRTAALQDKEEAVVGVTEGIDLPSPGPAGSLLLRLSGSGDVWCAGGRPEVAAFRSCATRFHDTASIPAHAFRARAAAARAAEVGLVALVPDDADLGPAIAGDDQHGLDRLLPHGRGNAGLAAVRLTLDAARQPWLTGTPGRGSWVTVYDGAAAAGFGDRCARLLLTLGRGHGWEFLSFRLPPSEAECRVWKHLPRLRLRGGAVLSPRRWWIDGPELAAIAAERGAAQYLAWRAALERRGIPDLVHVRASIAPEVLMRTDSALAVDTLFRKLPGETLRLCLEELPDDPQRWPVRDARGNHYLAELAVTWVYPDHWCRCGVRQD